MSELNGFFSLRTARDLLVKLEADFNRLSDADKSSIKAQYAAFDFFVCAEHIPDWLNETTGGSKNSHRDYPEGALVSHIASGAKHFHVRDKRHTTVKGTTSVQGAFQDNAFQAPAFQVPCLVVDLEDGSHAEVLDIATKVLRHWRSILP